MILILILPIVSYAASFNELSQRAYEVSGEIVQSAGYVDALRYEKASVLAHEPLSIEGSSRKIGADDSRNSGMGYGMMVGLTIKMPKVREAQALQYDAQSISRQKEIVFEQGRIGVLLKRDLLLAELGMEKIKILSDKVESSKEAHAIGLKKQNAGRMSQMEVLRLETEYEHAVQEHAKAVMEYDHIQHRLQEATMMHEEVRADDISFKYISREEQLALKVENAPSVLALSLRVKEIDAQIETLRRSLVESVSVGVGVTQEPMQNSLDFRLSIPLSWSDRNENKIAALMSGRSALVHRRDITIQKLQLTIQALVEHLKEREDRLRLAVLSQRKYEKLFTMVHKGLEGGVVTQFEYLATKNAFYEERLRSVELKQSYIEEMSEIEEKIGGVWE